jgi:hypothetical protein
MAAHRTCRLAFSVVLLLGLTGCPDNASDVCIPRPPSIQEEQPGVVLVGRQIRLTVHVSSSSGCPVSTPRADSVTAEIEGPDGAPVANQIELGPSRSTAVLPFTPERPGPHHILVAFSPEGGLHQFDLIAALDRSAEAPSEALSKACQNVERTLQGAWVCDTSVLRGSTVLGSFDGAWLAVAGDVVWVVDRLKVHRYVDTGTTFELTGSFTHGNNQAVIFLHASPDELLALFPFRLERYAFSEGALTATDSIPWIRPSTTVFQNLLYAVILREGDRIAIATRSGTGDDSGVQVCPSLLVSGKFQPATGACQVIRGETIGFEPRVLWTRDLPARTAEGLHQDFLHRWVWTGGQMVEQGSLELGPNAWVGNQSTFGVAALPLVYSSHAPPGYPSGPYVVTWSPQRQELLLELLAVDTFYSRASHTFFWGQTAQSSAAPTRVRLRPPPP